VNRVKADLCKLEKAIDEFNKDAKCLNACYDVRVDGVKVDRIVDDLKHDLLHGGDVCSDIAKLDCATDDLYRDVSHYYIG